MLHLREHLEAIRKDLTFFSSRLLQFFSFSKVSTKTDQNQTDFQIHIVQQFYYEFKFFFSDRYPHEYKFLCLSFPIRNDVKIFFQRIA